MIYLLDLAYILLLAVLIGILAQSGNSDPGAFMGVGGTYFLVFLIMYVLYLGATRRARSLARKQLGDAVANVSIRVWDVDRNNAGGCLLFGGWFFIFFDLPRRFISSRFCKGPVDLFLLKPKVEE